LLLPAFALTSLLLILLFVPGFVAAVKQCIATTAVFREGLVQVQEYSECVAFCEASEHEEHWAIIRLNKLVVDMWAKTKQYNFLDLVLETCLILSQGLPFLILSYRYLVPDEEYKELGLKADLLSTSAGNTTLLMECVMVFFKEGAILDTGRLCGSVKRIQELLNFFEEHEKQVKRSSEAIRYGHKTMHLDNVSVQTPQGHKLVQNLNIAVAPGESVLICGPSGVGKSSLLRVLCGLWEPKNGSITLPRKESLMFLSQSAYIPDMPRKDNTLRNQILFPHTLVPIEDDQIENALKRVNLGHLLGKKGIHTTGDWRKCLSGGERQRIVMARLLVAKPRMAFLDEATSALDTDNERCLFEELQASGATYITVAHKPELKMYHSHVLELLPRGRYRFYPCSEFQVVLPYEGAGAPIASTPKVQKKRQ